MPSEYWTDRIQACYESLTNEKKWAIDVIEDCVYIGVYTDQGMAFAGFNAWMDVNDCKSPIFNLMDSFGDPGVRPLGAMDLSQELRQKLLRGDVLVVMCLDVREFIKLGNEIYPGSIRLASKAETAKMKKDEPRIGNLTLDNRLIQMTLDGVTTYFGAGMRDRILFDQHSPSQLLAHRFAPREGASGTSSDQADSDGA